MNEWQHWQDNLAGKKPPIHDGEPQCGFYKRRLIKDGPWVPVAIWHTDANGLVCKVGDQMQDPIDQWTWVAGNPVSKADAKFAFEHSGRWPDEIEADAVGVIAEEMDAPDIALKTAIKSSLEWLEKNKITTEALAKKAATLKSKVAEKRLAATKAHKAEKEPHLDAGRRVDAKYNPLIKDAKSVESKIGAASHDYLSKKKRQEEAIAAAAAEAARKEQERLAEEHRKSQGNLPEEEKTEPIPVELPVAPKKVSVGGASGRKMTIKEDVEFVVTDYPKALKYFSQYSEVKDLIATLAKREGKRGVIADGVERKVVEIVK
jgi:hypothetical protein